MPSKWADRPPSPLVADDPLGLILAAPRRPAAALVLRLGAAVLAAYTAVVHLVLGLQDLGVLPGAHHHGDDHGHAGYVAVLFVVGAVLLAPVVVALLHGDHTPGWVVGGLVCAGMIAALVVSRETTWMPAGFHEHGYSTDAVACLAAETGFLLVLAARTVRRAQAQEGGDR